MARPAAGGAVSRSYYFANGADPPVAWGFRGGARSAEFASERFGIDLHSSGIDF